MDTPGGTQVQPGAPVFGADGGKVGSVIEVHPEYVVVEKGTFFPTDYFIPFSAIARVDEGGEVRLNVGKDEALNQAWANPPDRLVEGTSPGRGDESYDPTFGSGPRGSAGGGAAMDNLGRFAQAAEPAATAGLTGTTDEAGSEMMATLPGYEGGSVAGGTEEGGARNQVDLGASAAAGDQIRIPLHEEEIVPVKREVSLGAVRIEKEIVTEERTITVPVTEERLRITRLAPSDGTGGGVDAFEEEVIEIPIRGEEIEIVKRPRVANEVVIEKETIQRTERYADTVRREEVHVDEDVQDA